MAKRSKKAATVALAWVGWEYDDGIQSVHTTEPGDYNETVRHVPAELVKAYADAESAVRAAGEALLAAWAAAPEVPNPSYVPDDEEAVT